MKLDKNVEVAEPRVVVIRRRSPAMEVLARGIGKRSG